MSNRIREITIQNRLITPVEAEIWINVIPERMTATTEVRGRLVGPRCVYASTVEVAYSLRDLARPTEDPSSICKRVLIPEPSLWESACPFVYEGRIELWEDGQLCDEARVTHELRKHASSAEH